MFHPSHVSGRIFSTQWPNATNPVSNSIISTVPNPTLPLYCTYLKPFSRYSADRPKKESSAIANQQLDAENSTHYLHKTALHQAHSRPIIAPMPCVQATVIALSTSASVWKFWLMFFVWKWFLLISALVIHSIHATLTLQPQRVSISSHSKCLPIASTNISQVLSAWLGMAVEILIEF